MNERILIVEDSVELARSIKRGLDAAGYSVAIALDGEAALSAFEDKPADLVLTDLGLPKMDGITLCKKIRNHSPAVQIMILTAKSTELDLIVGLEVGADDYITKPFSFPELLARIRARFRGVQSLLESAAFDAPSELSFDDLKIDLLKHKVSICGRGVELTAKEFSVLVHMASNPGRVFTRGRLLEDLWKVSFDGYDHTVNTHINRLRNKIEKNPSKPEYIITVWGVGYKFMH